MVKEREPTPVRDALTQMQELFCLEFIKPSMPVSHAAAKAGYKSPRASASDLLENPLVIARIQELRDMAQSAAITTREERTKILSQIERTELADFVDEAGHIEVNRARLSTAGVSEVTQHSVTRQDKRGKNGKVVVFTTTAVKLRDPVAAIKEHNLMDGVYDDRFPGDDNRTYNFYLTGEGAKQGLNALLSGKRGLITEGKGDDNPSS